MSDNHKKHTGPWACPLWDHIDEIRSLRMARKSWEQISTEMKKHQIRLKARAIRNFFIRATDPSLKLPAGLEHLKRRYETEDPPAAKRKAKFLLEHEKKPMPKLEVAD